MAEDLARKIQDLFEQRAKHAEALVRIEETIGQIEQLLGTRISLAPRRGRPPKAATSQIAEPGRRRPRRGRGSYDVTAEEFVLGIVGRRGNPTTRDINVDWKSAGRGHTADNTLVKLVKSGRLQRLPLEGQRGSRYVLG